MMPGGLSPTRGIGESPEPGGRIGQILSRLEDLEDDMEGLKSD